MMVGDAVRDGASRMQVHGCQEFTVRKYDADLFITDRVRIQHGVNPEHARVFDNEDDVGAIVDWHLQLQRHTGLDACSPAAWST